MPSHLALQVEFSCLSVPDLQDVVTMDEAMEQEVFSRTGSSHSSKGPSAVHQCPFATLQSAAAILAVSNAHHEEHISQDQEEQSLLISSTNYFEPERIIRASTARAPRRYFRTFWRSITLRLLQHARPKSTC